MNLITSEGNEPRVSSIDIAENLGNQHDTVVRLIRKYRAGFEALGDFSEKYSGKSTGGRPAEYYLLNQEQVLLLFSFLKNTELAVNFKVKLIKSFADLAKQVQTPALPQDYEQSLVLLLDQVRTNKQLTAEIQQKTKELQVAQPKLICYERTMALGDTLSIDEAAKVLGYRPKQLRMFMRSFGWIQKRYNRGVPYQDKINLGYMTAKLTQYGPSARLTPKGIDAVSSHIGRLKAADECRYNIIFG
jgi:phage antirepressor YoqD-like protein